MIVIKPALLGSIVWKCEYTVSMLFYAANVVLLAWKFYTFGLEVLCLT